MDYDFSVKNSKYSNCVYYPFSFYFAYRFIQYKIINQTLTTKLHVSSSVLVIILLYRFFKFLYLSKIFLFFNTFIINI